MEALPWLVETCGATGGQILVDLTAPARHAHGQIDQVQQRKIDVWEGDLLWLEDWMPLGGGSLTHKPPARAVAAPDSPIVHIPIYEGRTLTGGLSLIFPETRPPDDPVIAAADALTQSVALVATLAMERYQLQRRLTQGNLLYEVSRAISSSLEIDDVLKFTTALAANALGAEASALLLVDHVIGEMAFVFVHGPTAEPLHGRRLPLNNSVVGRVARTGQPLIMNHITREVIFASLDEDGPGPRLRNMLCAPLQIKGQTLGVLLVLNREGEQKFSAEDLEWLMALAW